MRKLSKHYDFLPRDFTPSTLEACQNHSWPGNLKELETFVKRYLIAGEEELRSNAPDGSSAIDRRSAPSGASGTAKEEVEAVENELLIRGR